MVGVERDAYAAVDGMVKKQDEVVMVSVIGVADGLVKAVMEMTLKVCDEYDDGKRYEDDDDVEQMKAAVVATDVTDVVVE